MRQTVSIMSLLIAMASGLPSYAGEGAPSMKWGEVPMEQLKMNSYPPDSNAGAVILFDYGVTSFDKNYNVVFKRHVRIKILNRSAFEWATVKIPYYASQRVQRIDDIEGMTIWLTPEGEVKKQEMDSDAIFKEKLDKNNWEQMRFTLPSVTEGCVIEYRYERTSLNPYYTPDWDFQMSEPVLWSEYRFTVPTRYTYAILKFGYESLYIDESTEGKEALTASKMDFVRRFRWVMKDIPALRSEPFMTTTKDYRSRLQCQLVAYNIPGYLPERFLDTWDKVAEALDELPAFGRQFAKNRTSRKQAVAIAAEKATPLEKAQAIYGFVQNTIVWNKSLDMFVGEDLDDVLESKTGSSGEINLLLTHMLRGAGLQANPVLISTRNHGKVQKMYAMVDQFNDVLCRLTIDGNEYLLDATDRLRPFTLLPERALNYVGLSVDGKQHAWIDIAPSGKNRSTSILTLNLSSEGVLAGTAQLGFSDYAGVAHREKLTGKKPDEFVTDLFAAGAADIHVDSFAVNNREDISKSLVVDARISSTTYVQTAGDYLYMNPVIMNRKTENPLKLSGRKFPVEMAYAQATAYVLTLTVPLEYEVKELPKDTQVTLPFNGGAYTRRVELTDDKLNFSIRYEINQLRFEPNQYQMLRKFFERIVALDAEQLVFQKRPPASQKR